jgi:aminocarboxymuconate-semialdehyde decarboxylase
MQTRRDFIHGAASAAGAVVFTGCELLNARHAHAEGAPRRREVVVSGKRVKTVDIHAHCAFPDVNAMMGLKVAPVGLGHGAAERIQQMDAQGIDVEALSINPFWYKADRDLAEKLIRTQNEKLAEFCAAHPDRFVAFATTAMQYPELAAQQLEYGVKKLGLRGMSVGANVNGMELADPALHPVWAKAEELGCLIFIHPVGMPELQKRLQGNGDLRNTIGFPLDTTIALSHLIFEGTLDRFPGSRFVRRMVEVSCHPTPAASTPSAPAFPSDAKARRSRRSPPNTCGRCTMIQSYSDPRQCGI